MPPMTILALGLILATPQDRAPQKYRLVTPKEDGISAAALNNKGAIVGGEWYEEDDKPGQMAERAIYAEGDEITRIPLLEGYTSTFPLALSDQGRVAGRVSKPAPPNSKVFMRTQAFVWEKGKGIRGLGVLEGDMASMASGISRDGTVVAGATMGQNVMRVCLWQWKDGAWKGMALPFDKGMTGSTVAISPDARNVAALDGALPCLWTRNKSGQWEREVIGGTGEMAPRAVNDSGLVVGVATTPDGLSHAKVWSRDKGMKTLEKPPGYVHSEALAVNNQGVVVGMVDGPHGSEIGPDPFVFEGGKLRILDELGPFLGIATAINDRGEIAGVVTREEEAAPEK
ncbi:MAG: HAF repeat-containing protein [Isosphaeraceae bacterium]